jgi:hypothetical protein
MCKISSLLAVRYHLETKLKLVATTEKELKSPMDSWSSQLTLLQQVKVSHLLIGSFLSYQSW